MENFFGSTKLLTYNCLIILLQASAPWWTLSSIIGYTQHRPTKLFMHIYNADKRQCSINKGDGKIYHVSQCFTYEKNVSGDKFFLYKTSSSTVNFPGILSPRHSLQICGYKNYLLFSNRFSFFLVLVYYFFLLYWPLVK